MRVLRTKFFFLPKVLALCIAAVLLTRTLSASAQVTGRVLTANSFAALQQALAAAGTEDTTIRLTADITATDTLVIPADAHITLTDDGTPRKLSRAPAFYAAPLLTISPDGTAILRANAGLTVSGAGVTVSGRLSGALVECLGHLTLDGCELSGSVFNGRGAAGNVYVGPGAELVMNGGAIRDNQVTTGATLGSAGVLVDGGRFTLAGGQITHNLASVSSVNHGGGVHVQSGVFVMNGGAVTENRSGFGGGVAVEQGGAFEMNGGAVQNNAAEDGGGLFLWSEQVSLNAGDISGNTAQGYGGGLYAYGTGPDNAAVRLMDVAVYGNTALATGGSLYNCPVGSAYFFENDGAAFFDNTARQAGDEIYASANSYPGKSKTLTSRMLGGGTWLVYKDTADRYRLGDPPVSADAYRAFTGILALHAEPSAEDKTLALAAARLIIHGNTALNGGGLANNGDLYFGRDLPTPPETDPPETNPPETDLPETPTPETNPPETDPPETIPPETLAPETNPPTTDPPITPAPEPTPTPT
ncbi:MAG: hypothetical protein LBT60_00170, partial [Oscillospiraceae bacterium]|nr:hypothetical protein [Oscillospiraceae bacterium]